MDLEATIVIQAPRAYAGEMIVVHYYNTMSVHIIMSREIAVELRMRRAQLDFRALPLECRSLF